MATATEVLQRVIRGGSFLIEERSPDEIMTPEDFTEEQRQIARTASDFVRNEVLPEAEAIAAKHFDVTRAHTIRGDAGVACGIDRDVAGDIATADDGAGVIAAAAISCRALRSPGRVP